MTIKRIFESEVELHSIDKNVNVNCLSPSFLDSRSLDVVGSIMQDSSSIDVDIN